MRAHADPLGNWLKRTPKNLCGSSLVILVAMFLGMVQVTTRAVDGKAVMPKGLANVQLGMTSDELAGVRNLKAGADGPTNGHGVERMWTETGLDESYFDSVLYYFGTNGRLQVITAVRQIPSNAVGQGAGGFVQSSIARWGNEFTVKSAEIRHSGRVYLAPLLLWEGSDFLAVITYTPAEARADGMQGMFQTTIATKGYPLQRMFRIREEQGGRFVEEVRRLVPSAK